MSMPINNEVRHFDEWAATYDETVINSSTIHARYDELLDNVVNTANLSPGNKALDIGTGTGNLALRCLHRGAIVVALDHN
jgi:putative AdoMet-dependent methyltransferase